MEISDGPGVCDQVNDPMEREIRTVFRDTLGLIHIALVAHYGLQETEATELEKDLYLWFVRFCRRPGNENPRHARSFLLVASCQFAREYQKYVIGSGIRASDAKLDRLLEREPTEVAKDFSKSLELLTLRYTRQDV